MAGAAEIDAELERQRRFEEFLKIAWCIARRRLAAFALATLVLFAGIFGMLAHRAANKPDLWQASTTVTFYPKSATKIKAVDGDQVMQIFARRLMYAKLADMLRMDEFERQRLRDELSVTQERGRKTVYNIVAKGRTEADAMRRANTFAQLCVKEYVAYRTDDLQRWTDSIGLRKGEIANEMERVDTEETELNRKAGAISPLAESERLNNLVSENKAALSALQVKIINAEAKRKRLKGEVAELNPAAVKHAERLRKMQAERDKLKEEITRLEELYTEHNPKLQVVMGRLENADKAWKEFLAEHKIDEEDLPHLEDLKRSEKQLEETEAMLEALKEAKAAMDIEMAGNSAAARRLLEVIPQYDKIKSRRSTLRESLQSIEDTLSEVRYLQASIRSDISQVEPATYGICDTPRSKKRMLLALILAAGLGGMLLTACVAAEFAWGSIRDGGEPELYAGVHTLGELPPEDAHKGEFDPVFYRFEEAAGNAGAMYVGVLPGAEGAEDFLARLEVHMAMGGKRLAAVEIQKAKGARLPRGGKQMGIIVMAAGRGVAPVENIHSFSPSEMRLLQADVEELRKEYDLVALMRHVPETSRGVMPRQLMRFCDAGMAIIGVKKSPRRMLRYAVEHTRETEKPLITAIAARGGRGRG